MRMKNLKRAFVTVFTVIAVTAGLCTGSWVAHASPGLTSVRTTGTATSGATDPATPPGLAPCTKPLLGPVRQCESTSPTVDRWFNANAAAASCTLGFTINWGDGTPNWTGTMTDASPGEHLLNSHTYRKSNTVVNYTETVYNRVIGGSCSAPPPTTVFEFTYLPPVNQQQWWNALVMPSACAADLAPNPVDVGLTLLDLGQIIGVFAITGGWGIVFEVAEVTATGAAVYKVLFKAAKDCVNKAYSLGSLPQAYAYGASHPGRLFRPRAGTELRVPQITSVSTYTSGALDYFRLTYSDPGNDAVGFGFVGTDGAGWAEENHPFSSPSYGIVGRDQIDYPFNLLCGAANQYSSSVEAWIYDSQGVRSYPVQIALNCT
jgi:hypothetical protein